jgi:hypothetical protein
MTDMRELAEAQGDESLGAALEIHEGRCATGEEEWIHGETLEIHVQKAQVAYQFPSHVGRMKVADVHDADVRAKELVR